MVVGDEGLDPSELVRQLERVDVAGRRVQESVGRLTGVVGQGAAADGLIQVTARASGAIEKVTINPRAMRLGSQTLAEGLAEAANAAQAEAQRKSRELVAEALEEDAAVLDGEPSGMFQRMLEQIQMIEDRAGRSLGERLDALDRIRRRFD